MLILKQRLSGTEMKDLGMFSVIRKTNLCTAQRKRNAAKNQKSQEAADKSSKHCQKRQDIGGYSKSSEKEKFAWAFRSRLREEGISERGKLRSHISNIRKVKLTNPTLSG